MILKSLFCFNFLYVILILTWSYSIPPQEPGETEKNFANLDTSLLFKNLLSNRDPSPPCFPKEIGLSGLLKTPETLSLGCQKKILTTMAEYLKRQASLEDWTIIALWNCMFRASFLFDFDSILRTISMTSIQVIWVRLKPPLTFEQAAKTVQAAILRLRLASMRESICLKL